MRIVIITQGLSRIVKPLFASDHEIVGIAESVSGAAAATSGLRHKARYLLGWVFPRLRTLDQFAAAQHTPYFRLTKQRMPELARWLKDLGPDALVIFSMSQLLPADIFRLPRHGAINLHPSFLPEHRGPNPDFWQYVDAGPYGGATVHHIDEGEDTGDIIYQERVPIEAGIRSPDWLDRVIGHAGSRLLVKALDDLENDAAPRLPQPPTSPTPRARRISADEHRTIIDWQTWPIERVWHLLRGTETWLDAVSQPTGIFAGQRWKVGGYQHDLPASAPGTICTDRNGTYVACRDGKVRLSVTFSVAGLARYLITQSSRKKGNG